jgi:large conductance mechanosensitive channel
LVSNHYVVQILIVFTGGAFGKIVNSLVNDIIMPPIGWLLSGVDFANIYILLKRGRKGKLTHGTYKSLNHAKEDGAVTVNIGVFLNSVLNFVVISLIIFTLVRTITQSKNQQHTDSTKKCKYCFNKIDFRATRCPCCTAILSQQLSSPAITSSVTTEYHDNNNGNDQSKDDCEETSLKGRPRSVSVDELDERDYDDDNEKESRSKGSSKKEKNKESAKVLKKNLKRQLTSKYDFSTFF